MRKLFRDSFPSLFFDSVTLLIESILPLQRIIWNSPPIIRQSPQKLNLELIQLLWPTNLFRSSSYHRPNILLAIKVFPLQYVLALACGQEYARLSAETGFAFEEFGELFVGVGEAGVRGGDVRGDFLC
jgi:hypothetical protein